MQIYYPDINYIFPSSEQPGDTGKTLTIDGEGLISPFQNPPTVTVTNQASVFSSFYVQSFNYAAGTITVGYSVQSSAPAGTQTVTVNNGFGSGSIGITVVGTPIIDGSDGNPIHSSSTSPIPVLAGQQISLSVTAPSGQAIQSQSWWFGSPGDAVAGFAITETTGSALIYYLIVPGVTETVNVSVTYSSGATATTTEWYSVDGPTGISVSNLNPVAPVQILNDGAAIALGDGSQTDKPGPNYGIAVQAAAGHVPSANVGSNSRFQWVNIITGMGLNPRETGVAQPTICRSSVPLPALDSIYPNSN